MDQNNITNNTHQPFLFAGILLSAVVYTLTACGNDGKRDISAFYFPLEELEDGRVYAYSPEAGDSADMSYWYLYSDERDSGDFLTSTQYDRYFEIRQIVREKIVSSGSLARNTYLYELDTATGKSIPVRTTLESNNLFPFRVTDSLGVFLYRMHYTPPGDDSTRIYLIRNRRFLGDGPDFEFKGTPYPTIRMGIQEVIGHDREGSAEFKGHGEEWYAKGLGLVYYYKTYGLENQIRVAYRLTDTFPMVELERRARTR
ncbi:MAG: hypothetical protein EP344_15575 [Bacteroidetes bacterium]|nr:MAG: hypothetical protein EP344_15575 [Bacteroidota bacterium]